MEKPPEEMTSKFSFLYVHPPVACPANKSEPVIEQTIDAVSRGEAITSARQKVVKGLCGHTYELAAKPPKQH